MSESTLRDAAAMPLHAQRRSAQAPDAPQILLADFQCPAHQENRVEWLIDSAQTYGPLLEALRRARRSVRIAQLAFDSDCAAYTHAPPARTPSRDSVIAETLIDLATGDGPEIRILLNASWMLNTARPLRKFLAARGVSAERIEVRGMSRFPHFLHAKLVLIDQREAFLLGSPFVNSYWDEGSHAPFDSRRPLRELGGRPLHDVSVRLRGAVVADLEAMFAGVWQSCGERQGRGSRRLANRASRSQPPAPTPGTRVVHDAPDGFLPDVPDRTMRMLAALLAGIASARDFIYIEHQYLTSRPIVAALVNALRVVPELEIIIVVNQNPDITAYRDWQNSRLAEHALLTHPRVGVFSLWSTDAHPERAGVTRINQLFIHSKVMIVDDAWAAVGSSNLDGVSMGDYGDDFAGALGRRVFRGVRNVEVNVVIDARDASDTGGTHERSRARHAPAMHEEEAEAIAELRERLWHEHLGVPRIALRERPTDGWLATWRAAAAGNVQMLSASGADRPPMAGRVLPYSSRAFPSEQLRDIGIRLVAPAHELCYNPTWFGVHASPHWVRNIF